MSGIRNSADIIGVVGASGMGKGIYVKGELRKLPRSRPVLVWSPLEVTDDYAAVIGGKVVDSIAALVKRIKAGDKRLVLVPGGSPADVKVAFDRFCRIAWELEGWCIVVEELSRVTSPSWAPPAWKNLSTAGRHRGLKIFGTSQRPAQVDKDFFGNCTEIRCYAVGYKADAVAMADTMFLDYREVLALPKFHYIHRDKATGKNVNGVVPLPKS
ncbi:hypothetical protein [Burkholderia perseverans]|uniref:hypothetical protein n=1 Tax=Burkholderia perseverans TaxID=2615214 RepID=UPI001FF04A78|nr:hypothetical protein [Burkholderia perseverans]